MPARRRAPSTAATPTPAPSAAAGEGETGRAAPPPPREGRGLGGEAGNLRPAAVQAGQRQRADGGRLRAGLLEGQPGLEPGAQPGAHQRPERLGLPLAGRPVRAVGLADDGPPGHPGLTVAAGPKLNAHAALIAAVRAPVDADVGAGERGLESGRGVGGARPLGGQARGVPALARQPHAIGEAGPEIAAGQHQIGHPDGDRPGRLRAGATARDAARAGLGRRCRAADRPSSPPTPSARASRRTSGA